MNNLRKLVSSLLMFLNYLAIFAGFTSLCIDCSLQKISKSKLVNYYVVIANLFTVLLLPFAHAISINYITASFKNNLLAFTDSVNLFINYIVVVFTVVSRCRRENIYQEISLELFKLERSYFRRLPSNLRIQNRADWVLFIKMCSLSLVLFVPCYGVLQQAIRVDNNVIMLAMYSSFIHGLLHGVMFLFFLMLWLVRKRVWLLNAHLDELLNSQQRLHRNAATILVSSSATLQRLSELAAEELREIARVHGSLSTLLLRANSAYRWQVIAVLLTYIINSISYGFYWLVIMEGSIYKRQSALSILASILASTTVFIDMNLLYWTADATAVAFQHTSYIVRQFQALPLMGAIFERQCESFALQLKQQKMHINIAGMFHLSCGTSLAMWAFNVRHILILVQFDYEARKYSNRSSGVLEHIIRVLQFGENWEEE